MSHTFIKLPETPTWVSGMLLRRTSRAYSHHADESRHILVEERFFDPGVPHEKVSVLDHAINIALPQR